VLSAGDSDLYDVAGDDPRLAEALVTPREAASIAAIAAEVRAAIFSGAYPVGAQLPTRARLAADKGVSAESISVVMRMLAAEGLLSLEQGRGTFVLPRRRYHVTVLVPRSGAPATASEGQRLLTALEASAAKEPAVRGDLLPETSDDEITVSMVVESAGPPQAVTIAYAVARNARSPHWDWDGWDLSAASVTARPA